MRDASTEVTTSQRRTATDVLLFFKALLLVARIRFGLAFSSFGRVSTSLALDTESQGFPGPSEADSTIDSRLVWAVSKASRVIRTDKPCLAQAMALQHMLHKHGRPAELVIGVAKNDDETLKAHAWVEQEGRVLIGGQSSPRRYTRLSSLDEYRS